MKTTRIRIKGMTCLNCVTHVQKALEAVPGVQEAEVTLDEGARVSHADVDEQSLLRAIQAAGDYHGEIASDVAGGGTARTLIISFGLCAAMVASTFAADHQNLEEGLPVEVEDAYPIAFRGREFQSSFRYERTDGGKDRFVIDPRIEFGFAPNWQGKIAVPVYLGSADRTDSGNIGLEAFYNFNTESLSLPAFALSLRGDLPTGKDSAGVDTTLKGIVTKSITRGGLDRIHLNVAWKHNAGARSGQRDDLYRAILGYSRPLDADTIVIADFVREQEIEEGHEANVFEIGIRRQLTPLMLIAVGLGAGVGDESPPFRATLGLQKSF
jgi:copper chaperone CopZ